jgi:hypothetical protein
MNLGMKIMPLEAIPAFYLLTINNNTSMATIQTFEVEVALNPLNVGS